MERGALVWITVVVFLAACVEWNQKSPEQPLPDSPASTEVPVAEEPAGATGSVPNGAAPDLAADLDPMSPVLDPQQVPILIAQGLMGRTTLSCDDGQSWMPDQDRSFDRELVDAQGNVTKASDMVCGSTQQVRCGQSSCQKKNPDGTCSPVATCDCLHHQGYGKGVVIAKNQIWANFGWGAPGVMLNSQDGARWGNPYYFDAGNLYPNVVFGDERFVHFSSLPHLSDDGVAWRTGASAGFNGPGQPWTSPRAFNYLKYGAGSRFIGAIDGNTIRVSADRGETWSLATSVPAGCTDGIGNTQRIITGNGVALMVTSSGRACRSADGGMTWTLHDIAPERTTDILTRFGVFAGGKFLAWERLSAFRYSSLDGQTWTRQALTKAVWPAGPIGVSQLGTLVGVNSVDIAYESQRFYRSTDLGLTWTPLEDGKFVKSHAIQHIQSGTISRASGVCQ